mgnify:CR=1 FL=1
MRISFLLIFLLTFSSLAISNDKDTLWEISCRIPSENSIFEIDVYKNDVTYAFDFKKKRSMHSGWFSNITLVGHSTSLLITQSSKFTNSSIRTIRLEWWNTSNPELLNSFYVKSSWDSDGQLYLSSLVKMNCKASKSIKSNIPNTLIQNGRDKVHWGEISRYPVIRKD